MNFTLYPHGGSCNHGCEAIIRATAKLVGNQITLFSENPTEDFSVGLNNLCQINKATKKIKRCSWDYVKAFISYRIFKDSISFDKLTFSHILGNAKQSDYFLSIGGDNYCYGKPTLIYLINTLLDKQNTKRILWGASIEPSEIDYEMRKDLQGYYRIWARESLTYHALRDLGLKQTSLIPDPAFVLEKKECPTPDCFLEGNTVGINISPMIINHETHEGGTLNNYIQLIRHILEDTTMNVALIPHVTWKDNDDREPLKLLYDLFSSTGRICMIIDHNAEELKGYIARCRFMVAARTHASIAAYSTYIPTLVVGYSVKAKGIAIDIFGTDEHYVIPVQHLSEGNELSDAFHWIKDHEEDIRNRLKSFIPEYIRPLYHISELLELHL